MNLINFVLQGNNMSNELNLSNDPYIIVSSDSHAGLQCEEYRPYLESSVHEEFDEYVAERHEHRRLTEEVNGEYVAEWEGKNAEGLKGAYDPDIRDKELDADDGEVTRTRKVRRNIIADRYQPLIDALHDDSKTHCSIETEMTFEDGRKGTVEADLRIMNLQKINSPVHAKAA